MLKKIFFGFVPTSPTQMGSLSAKNASKKFSRLGTFKEIYFAFSKAICEIDAQVVFQLKWDILQFIILPHVCDFRTVV
jgi:hypothetical protein